MNRKTTDHGFLLSQIGGLLSLFAAVKKDFDETRLMQSEFIQNAEARLSKDDEHLAALNEAVEKYQGDIAQANEALEA